MNDFNTDLDFSYSAEDSPIWKEIYDKAFPGNLGFTNMRTNGQTQKLGIDRTVILSSGKAIYIDEKVRRKDYQDILLEYISNNKTGTLGWAEKPLFSDYIAYAVLPSKICFLLPVPQLQSCWKANKDKWLEQYGIIPADNKTYTTFSCPIPVRVLYPAIGNSLRITFAYGGNLG